MMTAAEREALITAHMDFARALAKDIARSLPRSASVEDLVASAIEGLVDAASRFDPTRGWQFTTFAYYRVRGAVFDQIRKLAQAEPRIRNRAAALAAADDAVETTGGAQPRSATTSPADAAGTLAQVLETAAASFAVAECSEAMLGESLGASPEDRAAERQRSVDVRSAIERLPERERTMLQSVYFQGLTIEAAGATMGLSKSWASRLHARALGLVKNIVSQHAP